MLKQTLISPFASRGTLALIVSALSLLILGGVNTQAARADDVRDYTCQPDPSYPICNNNPGIYRVGPGRCDMTAKFLGGNVSQVMFSFQGVDGYDGSKPWSGWMGVNGTYSHSFYGNDWVIGQVWKAQSNRTAYWRFRVSGPCYFM